MENSLLGRFMVESEVHDLKSRLEWGQPGFTVVDIRDRQTYNKGHIMGAISLPVDDLIKRANLSLSKSRDIYLYGENDQQTAHVAQTLREAGFDRVSGLKGGLSAWKAIGGATEGEA